MIDHAVLRVKDLGKSRRFYAAALAPLGYRVLKEFPGFVGLGAGDKTDIWIGQAEPTTTGVHLAIASRDRRTVDAFHAAALKAGGKDNGAPGVRAHYHPHYYGAFVIDLDGNNIEAVCHDANG
ncbi:MAG: glyoxalase [Acidobacteria bacterium 13_1_40CM_2_68_5]|nr:MAG: glyoxalase [Acidobacteria bacterium 13_1_40CM_2_68_5]